MKFNLLLTEYYSSRNQF